MKNFHFFSKIFLFLLLIVNFSYSYFKKNEAGQEVFSFVALFQSPRNTALEHANAAEPSNDPGISFLNPAALRVPEGENNNIAFYWNTGDLAENQGVITYVRALNTIVVQATYGWIAYGDIDEIDENAEETGKTHSPLSSLFALSASILFRHIQVGVTTKLITDKLTDDSEDQVALGLAFDWGISWISENERYGLTLSARDFGTMIRDYSDDGELSSYAMSQTFALAAFFKPRPLPRLSLYLESTFPRYSQSALRLAAEYALSSHFYLRGGFSRTWLDLSRDFKELFASAERPDEANEIRLFSLGLGYLYSNFGLDYSFSYLTQGMGLEHRVGILFAF